jgi:hypothetical protein
MTSTSGKQETEGTEQPTTGVSTSTKAIVSASATQVVTTTGQKTESTTEEQCQHMEYIETLIDNNGVSIVGDKTHDVKNLIETGVDFTETSPSIVVHIPGDGALIQDIKVRSSNILEIVVSFTTVSGTPTASVRGEPTNLPKSEFPDEKVRTILIEVVQTVHDKAPKGVTLSVVACAPGTTPSAATTGKSSNFYRFCESS